MSLKDDSQAPQRRRGAALENALLDAAWEELEEKGYDAFTFESVAERAGTSRAVLSRRWATKPELVLAAVGHSGMKGRVEVPDTGSLRDDVIELLRRANRARARVSVMLVARLGPYFVETGSSIAEVRERLMGGRVTATTTLVQRAVERGEVDPAKLTPRVIALPFDLFRHELLMTLRPVPDEVIESIVDEVFLPLVRPADS